MNGKAFTLAAAAGTLFIAGSATADFVGAQIVTVGSDGTNTQYQVELIFDNPADILNSVGGAAGMEMLQFNTDAPDGLVNVSGGAGFGPNLFNAYGAPGSVDSYLTINFNAGAATTPNFFATLPSNAVTGTSWSVADDGYFVAGGDAVGANTAVIANFVVADGFGIGYSGLVGWTGDGTGGLTPFSVNNKDEIPAPGALALLGLAGLAGSRRRRR